jgi:hypothetical protein
MSFWDKILSNKKPTAPRISFGRYSDAYKSKDRYLAWDESLRLFEEGKFLESIKYLLDYLKNDNSDNIQINASSANIQFTLFHGSKQISCTVDEHKLRAESKVAHCKELNVGFLRKAVEFNYVLNYSRFALDGDNNLCLLFDSMLAEASPYKLFYGLKELALQSDKEDDILIDEFESLEPLQNQHIIQLPEAVIKIKLNFIRDKIQIAISPEAMGKLNPKRFQGALTYVYLSVVYGIDYLIKPEGPLLDILSRLHIKYFETPSEDVESKVTLLEQGLKEMNAMTDEEITKELYDVISTFGITSPANHKTISQFIDAELQAMKWYEENKHETVCISICNYITGYCFYNFAMPAPDHDLFHLYYEIMEADYFKKLGFVNNYWNEEKKKVQLNVVYERIEEILKEHKDAFPELPVTTSLDGANLVSFLKSYLLFIKNLPVN